MQEIIETIDNFDPKVVKLVRICNYANFWLMCKNVIGFWYEIHVPFCTFIYVDYLCFLQLLQTVCWYLNFLQLSLTAFRFLVIFNIKLIIWISYWYFYYSLFNRYHKNVSDDCIYNFFLNGTVCQGIYFKLKAFFPDLIIDIVISVTVYFFKI